MFHGEFWLFSPESAVGLGNLHSFAGAHADEVGFELSDHRQDVEQQFAHWVGGVVDGTTDAESDFASGEAVGYLVGVSDGPGQAVEFGNDEGISGPAGGEGFVKSCAILVPAGKAMASCDRPSERRYARRCAPNCCLRGDEVAGTTTNCTAESAGKPATNTLLACTLMGC